MYINMKLTRNCLSVISSEEEACIQDGRRGGARGGSPQPHRHQRHAAGGGTLTVSCPSYWTPRWPGTVSNGTVISICCVHCCELTK